MAIWRLDPEVEPAAAGVDAATLEEMARRFTDVAEEGKLFGGAQLAVYRHGRKVLDIGGGIARRRINVPVNPDTMFVIFSSTKGLAALAMWILHERTGFSFDDPVVKYWPTFASQVPEKAKVTIRHVMGHRGGFPRGPEWFTARHWNNREALVRAMEEAPLLWTPGEACGYHELNFGWVLDELCRRIDPRGRDIGTFLREEALLPLGIEDCYIGLPEDMALEERVAWVEEPEEALTVAQATGVAAGAAAGAPAPGPGGLPFRAPITQESHRLTPELSIPWNRPGVHRAVVPGGGGISTARALAKLYAALALGGELDGVRIVRRESLEEAIIPTTKPGEVDRTIRVPARWGTGWSIGSMAEGASSRTFGHGGRGGQMGLCDLDRGLAYGFTTTGQLRAEDYQRWQLDMQSLAFKACKD